MERLRARHRPLNLLYLRPKGNNEQWQDWKVGGLPIYQRYRASYRGSQGK